MSYKYLKWTLPVLSIVWLLNPTIVVGSDFLSWADSISNCPECESASVDFYSYSKRNSSTVPPTEERGVRTTFPGLPRCADPTPPEFIGGNLKKAKDRITRDLVGGGNKVNDDSDGSWQDTEVEDMDINLPDELADLVNCGAKVVLVDDSNNMGLVTECSSTGDLQFASSAGGLPAKDRSGKARGVVAIPPSCSKKKMASRRSLRDAFAGHGIPIDKCSVCNDDSASFVTKQQFVEILAAIFQKSTTTIYDDKLVPRSWKDKTERLYKDELAGLIEIIGDTCQQTPVCGGGNDGEKKKFNSFCGCLENSYSDYFPGPVQTEESSYEGSTIYFRFYSLNSCGACGQYASESALASYQNETYYSFDWNWEYLAPLDDALYYFCP